MKVSLLLISILITLPIFANKYLILSPLNKNMELTKVFNDSNVESIDLLIGRLYISNNLDQKSLKTLQEMDGVIVEKNFTVSTFSDIEKRKNPRVIKGGDHRKMQWALDNKGNNEPVTPKQPSTLSGKVGADINTKVMWPITMGNKEIKIAVMDSGVDYNHPDLKGQMWINESEKNGKAGIDDDGNGYIDDISGYDFANNDNDPMDDNGHGTHCSGIIGALHNDIGIDGVMKNVSIIPIKFLDKKGKGDMAVTLKSLDYAIRLQPHVISASWGGSETSDILKELIAEAGRRNIAFVAAAGNLRGRNNDVNPTYPASFKLDNVISISAHTAQNYHSDFSTWGPESVLTAAPGTNIISTWPDNQYKVASGTSMSAPFVSGVLGLLFSIDPNYPVARMKEKLLETSVEGKGYSGKNKAKGRVDGGAFINSTLL